MLKRLLSHNLLFTVAVLLSLVFCHSVEASSIGVVLSNESAPFHESVQGFRKYLQQHGLTHNVIIHSLLKDGDRPENIAQTIEKGKCDFILALGNQATKVLSQRDHGLPIIAALVFTSTDITMLSNATGVFLEIPLDIQLSLIKRLFPKARKVGVVYSNENKKKIDEALKISSRLGLTVEGQEASIPKEIPDAIEMAGKSADLLWGLMDKLVLSPETAKQILLFCLRNEIPFIGPSENWAKAGAAAAFGWSFDDIGAQCGEMFIKLASGTKAEKMAPCGPRKIEYTLNLRAAEQIKIDFSPEVIKGAKQVYDGD